MTPPNSFIWAVWTAEGSDYLEKLDDNVGGCVPPGGPNPGLVDISHVRWATANAITAIDLCAATMGRQFWSTTATTNALTRSSASDAESTIILRAFV